MILNAKQVQERKVTLLEQEHEQSPALWWMSFRDPNKPKGRQFLGVAIVEAPGFMHAVQKTWELNINPGGEIVAEQVEGVSVEYHNRLLSRADLEAAGLV